MPVIELDNSALRSTVAFTGRLACMSRAEAALRSGPEHAGAFSEMVLAQGLGNEDRQASRDEEGDRGAGTSAGRDHAPHVG
jgi:hypothetical protein